MNPNLAEAKRLMENGGYTCVLYKDGITHTSTKRGVLPLKEWLEKKTELKGFSAADKVVERRQPSCMSSWVSGRYMPA